MNQRINFQSFRRSIISGLGSIISCLEDQLFMVWRINYLWFRGLFIFGSKELLFLVQRINYLWLEGSSIYGLKDQLFLPFKFVSMPVPIYNPQ